jgi:hypothetical protein
MKKLFYTLVFVLIVQCTFTISNVMSQWQSDVRLTNDPGLSYTTSYGNEKGIASSGDTVHVVWFDNRAAQGYEIYYKRSIDGGINWGTDTRLTNNVYYSADPSIAVSGSVVHVVWDDLRDGNDEIYYKHSTDGGTTWGADTRVTFDSSLSRNPCVSASGLFVHVVWGDYNTLDIFYKRSTDGGLTWGTATRFTNDSAASWYPSIAVSGSIVHVVWQDGRGGNANVYYKRSSDGGITWGADTALTNNLTTTYLSISSMYVSGSVLHVVWTNPVDGGINHKGSTNGGITWGLDSRVTNNPAVTYTPSVTFSGSNVHVVWSVNRDGNFEIYYNRSTDGGLSWGTDTRLTNDPGYSFRSFVSVSGTAVHVLWTDNRDGNFEIYYKRNPTGNPVGIINISTGIPSSFSLGQNYPNPFNPTTKIRFTVPALSSQHDLSWNPVRLKVYDITGREVQTLVNESLAPGTYETSFDGSKYNSGVYFYKLSTEGFSDVKKMLMIK